MDVVFARKDRLDYQTGIRKTVLADSPEQLTDQNATYVVWPSDQLDSYLTGEYHLYIPCGDVKQEHIGLDHLSVYFDLENYPFFKKMAEEIGEQTKGVLRFRRLIKNDYHALIMAEDLYVLSAVFGDPERVKVVQSDQQAAPSHVILTIKFSKGTMAHLEYTFAEGERIEWEWSGIKTILEFDSEEMNPFVPNAYSSFPLNYTIDSIIEQSHKLSPEFLAKMERFHALVKGGTES
ncbi:hypothetical protein SAMN05877753_106167 [Bacillus oleivorans]|uniref:Uncharacterized protein n=1 Tax=Bacillus oleivorans TaxID=1448271 RepID=A0A285CYP6_9BACI|nr:hypothetical protein [Bacillus oleivorans]SNX72671.1 hypothetical protein SAMN05877753_106167 [Bacillus oleivorans]